MSQDENSESDKFHPSYVGERPDVLGLIRPDVEKLLDIGCSDGTFGLSVKNKNRATEVIGVEYDPAMAAVAEHRLDEVYVVNLNEISLGSLLSKHSFDCIVMADILEHLIDPWRMVKECTKILRKDGRIITSIPNVRHISTIITLTLRGRWPYRKRGIHDESHLRFFTHSNIVEMFTEAGLAAVSERRNMRILERKSSGISRLAKLLDLPGIRSFYTFQYLHEWMLTENCKGT